MGQVFARIGELHLLVFALVAMMAVRAIMIATNFDPNYDQAMLLANFPLERASDLFRPLPFFEQTTTLGHGVLLEFMSQYFGAEGMARLTAIRMLSALAFCGSLLWLYFLMRGAFSRAEALLAIVLMGGSPLAMDQTPDTKHYVFEFVAAVAMLGAALHYLKRPGWLRGFIVILAGTFTALFSFVAPVTIAAVGIASLVAQLADARQQDPDPPQIWRTIAGTLAVGAALVAVAAGFYLGYTRVVTANDLMAFSDRDAQKFIEIGDLTSQQSLRNMLEYGMYFFRFIEIGIDETGASDRLERILMAVSAVALYAIGVASLSRRSPFWAAAAIATPVVTLSLNLAQVMPISGVRQHMFAAPMIAPAMVLGLVRVFDWVACRLGVPGASNAVLAGIAVASVGFSAAGAMTAKDVVSGLVDHMEESGAPVWVYYGAQPIIRTLQPGWLSGRDVKLLGLLSHETGKEPWLRQARAKDDSGILPDYYLSETRVIAGHDRLWLVFANWMFDFARAEGLEGFIRHARGPGRDCAVWHYPYRTLVAFCGPQGDVDAMLARTPPDDTSEWEALDPSGEWRRYVKGDTGRLVREGGF